MRIYGIKIKCLNIEYKQGILGFLLTEDAIKEFCDYSNIQYDDKDICTSGIVTTKKSFIHTEMMRTFSKIATNNWRKQHGIPMRRKCFDTKRS